MRVDGRKRPGTLASILALALAAFMAVLLAAQPGSAMPVFAGQSVGSGDEPSGDRLLVSSRNRLAVCVQPSAGLTLDRQATLSAVTAALSVVGQHPDWVAERLGRVAPTVDAGCPSEGLLLRPGVQFENGQVTAYPPDAVVAHASTYYLFVLVLPRDRIATLFPPATRSGAPIAVQEVSCAGGTCRDVTFGLYLAPDQLGDAQAVGGWIGQSLGLKPLPAQSGTARSAGAQASQAGANAQTGEFTPAASALTLTLRSSVVPLSLGQTTRLDGTIRNNGATDATATTYTSTLPVGLNHVSTIVTDANFNGVGVTCTYTSATRLVSCPIGTVGTSGAAQTRIVQTIVRAGLRGTVNVSATVVSSADVQPGGVSAEIPITANPLTCAPRSAANDPKVSFQYERVDANTLNVTVTAGTTNAPTNRLEKLTFSQTNGAFVDFPGGPTGLTGAFERVLADGPSSASFVIRRSGAGAATVRYAVVDYCTDPWLSFAGLGGPVSNMTAPDSLLLGVMLDDRQLTALR